jgi:hypothetical protein
MLLTPFYRYDPSVNCSLLKVSNVHDQLQSYDGVRRRILPMLYAAIDERKEDDQVKGALFTLNIMSVARYILSGRFHVKR